MMKILTLLIPALFLACGQAANTEKTPAAASSAEPTETPAAPATEPSQSPTSGVAPGGTPLSAPASGSQANVPNASLTTTHWKLLELNGKSVAGTTAREMYIILAPDTPVFRGDTGCNTIFGEIKSNGPGQLLFLSVIPTSMDCRTPDTEAAFIKALEEVNTFSIKGNTLSLGKKNMPPSLQFIAKG